MICNYQQNPVEEALVFSWEDYWYSSAIDYADVQGLRDDPMVFRMFDFYLNQPGQTKGLAMLNRPFRYADSLN